MANRAKRMCTYPGCSALVSDSTRCPAHKRTNEYDQRRGTPQERGYDNRWRKYRAWFLKKNPLCIECLKSGDITPSTVVDHIKPHKGDMGLFWDSKNHQALCKRCHDRKTAREDGGFGNKIKN